MALRSIAPRNSIVIALIATLFLTTFPALTEKVHAFVIRCDKPWKQMCCSPGATDPTNVKCTAEFKVKCCGEHCPAVPDPDECVLENIGYCLPPEGHGKCVTPDEVGFCALPETIGQCIPPEGYGRCPEQPECPACNCDCFCTKACAPYIGKVADMHEAHRLCKGLGFPKSLCKRRVRRCWDECEGVE